MLEPVQLNEVDSQALNDLIDLVDDVQVVQNATDAARIGSSSDDANSIENDVLDVRTQPEEEANGNGSNDNQLAKGAEVCVGLLVAIEHDHSTQQANQEEISHEVSGNEVTSVDNAGERGQTVAQIDQSNNTIVEDAVIDMEQSETADNDVPIQNLTLYQPTDDEEAVRTENGSIEIIKTYEDGMQMRYVLGQQIRPIPSPYEVKANDLFSGNLPFQANVSFDSKC